MLSEKICALREPLEKFAGTGITLDPKALVSVIVILRTLEAEARGLERFLAVVPVDPPGPVGARLPDNVVRLFQAAPIRRGERS